MATRQKWMHLPGASYAIYETKEGVTAEGAAAAVKDALKTGDVAEVDVIGDRDQLMKVFVNGKSVGYVTFDLASTGDPKPGEVGKPQT